MEDSSTNKKLYSSFPSEILTDEFSLLSGYQDHLLSALGPAPESTSIQTLDLQNVSQLPLQQLEIQQFKNRSLKLFIHDAQTELYFQRDI